MMVLPMVSLARLGLSCHITGGVDVACASLLTLGVPSGKHTKNYGTAPFFMGKPTIHGSFLYAYLWGYSLISWRGSIEMTPQHIPLTRGKSTNDGRGIIPSFTSQVCYSFTDHSLHRATMFARDPQFFVRSTSVIIPRRCHFRYRSPF